MLRDNSFADKRVSLVNVSTKLTYRERSEHYHFVENERYRA